MRFNKARRKLIVNSRGFSSIVGAVFAILVMMSLISTVFVWSLSQNTLYNNTVTQTRQADLDRSKENIAANVTCYGDGLGATGTALVNGTLENDGSLSAQIVTLWVVDATNKNYNHTALNIILLPGSQKNLSQYLVPSTAIVVTLPNSVGDSLGCWFISARGNTISEKPYTIINNYTTTGTGTTPFALVSGGIGSISMDFSSFSHYDNVGTANGSSVGSPVYGYTISGSINTILHVKVTNYDYYNRTLTITGGSMWAITPFSGTIKGDQWIIANVTSGKLITTGTYSQIINLTQAVDLYFGPNMASRSAGNIVPLFILLYGQATYPNGTKIDYGQNLPFIALNVT